MTWCRCAFSSPMINWILPDQCVVHWGLRCHQNCCREFLVCWIISSAIQSSWFSRSWPIYKSVSCFSLQSTIIHDHAFKFWLSNRYSSPANSLNLSQSVIGVKISVAFRCGTIISTRCEDCLLISPSCRDRVSLSAVFHEPVLLLDPSQ